MSESTVVQAVITLSEGTAATWNATTIAIPAGMYCFETDTRRAKIGDGETLYSSLAYHVGTAGTLNLGQGVRNDGSGNLTLELADTSLVLSNNGVSVNSAGISNVAVNHETVSTGTVNIDRSVSSQHIMTIGGAVALDFINFPGGGNYSEANIAMTNGGSATVTFPTVNWVMSTGAFATTLSAAGITLQNTGTDFIKVWTYDGANFFGTVLR